MKKRIGYTYIATMVILIASSVQAQDNGSFSGLMYGDYYAILQNHEESLEGENAFWFRRIYLTYDRKLNNSFDYRFRIEMNASGDFESKSKLVPYIKDAYLKWTRDNHSIYLGISPSPTWEVLESVWGYRSVEKTPLDLQKLGTSREFGIAIKGSFDRNRKFNYHFMLGNGNATNSEVGKGKKAMVSLSAIPVAGLVIEGYADFDDRPNGKRRMTFQGFAGLELEKIRFGLQYVHQSRRQGRGLDDMSLRILSVFSVARLSGQVNAIVRLDRMFDPNPDGATISYIPFDPNASFNFLLVGLDINAGENVKIVPNVESVFYDAVKTGKKPTTDVIPRMTVVVTF